MNRFPLLNRARIASLARQAILVIILLALMLSLAPAPFPARAQLPAPQLVSPPNYETTTVSDYPPAAVPLFEWTPVPGATTYRIQIDKEVGFGTPIEYDVTTPNTRYIPLDNAKLTDGDWYWRVRVDAPAPVSDWSEIRRFTKSWGHTSNAPTLLAPGSGATIEFFEAPIFSWTAVPGAAEYMLRVYSDPDCTARVQQIAEVATLTTRYSPSARWTNGTYYWRVTPRNPASQEGQPSECRAVTVGYEQKPTLLTPANNSQPVYTPRFEWTAVKGATSYNLYYGTTYNFQAGTYTKITTNQTAYTPKESLPNDQDYYWRVSTVYGGSAEGSFSDVWRFQKKWYQKPINLTPVNNELTNVTLFSWTPVREAKYYRIELSFEPGFAEASIKWKKDTPNTFYWHTSWCDATPCEWGRTMYWRVTPYDNSNRAGQHSIVTSFRPTYTVSMPKAVFPRYFYTPPSAGAGHYAPPYNIPLSYDYTADVPTFYWMRTFVPPLTTADPRIEAHHYKIEVDDDPNFGSINWAYRTQNLSATPTDGAPFEPQANTDYYWRVTAYAESGAVLTRTVTIVPWKMQIDISRVPTVTATASPVLQRPMDGEFVMDILPSFEWLPQQGAVRYEFMLSDDPAFSTSTYVTRTIYTHHTPPARLLGTYFWRVRGLDSAGQTVGQWSSGRRLIVAMQTRWIPERTYPAALLPAYVKTRLAADTDDGLGAVELTSLHAAQDKFYWYLGFHVNPAPGNTVWYGLYLDTNQTDGSGASGAPANRPSIATSSYCRPEYAIYVVYSNTAFIDTTVYLHKWDPVGGAWEALVRNLVDPVQVGGAFHYTPTLNYVELKIPKTAIGDLGSQTYALSAALFSAPSNSAATASDTVPNNGHIVSVLKEFKTIADQFTLAVPVDSPPDVFPLIPYTPYVYGIVADTDWWRGFKTEVSRDPNFSASDIMDNQIVDCKGCNNYIDIIQNMYSPMRVYEDNTLYWRMYIRHRYPYSDNPADDSYSPPSRPHAFTKVGLTPQNLRVEGDYSTPTFIWDAVEGAAAYNLQVATNPDFSPTVFDQKVNHESYTPNAQESASISAPGKYYWRVRVENSQGGVTYQGNWSAVSTVNVTLPVVTLLEPAPGAIVSYAPTFKWQTVLTPTVQPRWGAPRYRLQVATTPTGFSSPFEDVIADTINWTPTKSYPDGTYYWRVAVRDAAGKDGPFSPVCSFTKQYPVVTLVSPLTGTVTGGFPTFVWTAVDGAARYKIEIAKNPNFSPKYDEATTNNTRFTPAKRYDTTTYYWRVAIMDKSNNYGPWTNSVVIVNPYPHRIFLPLVLKNKK